MNYFHNIIYYTIIAFIFKTNSSVQYAQKDNIYHVFMHGTIENLPLFKDKFKPAFSLVFFLNSIKSAWFSVFDYYWRKSLYKSTKKFLQYKNREKLFLINEWPALIGSHKGLHVIKHGKSQCSTSGCSHCISNIAFQYLYLPFLQKMEDMEPAKNHILCMFNWGGDLSGTDRLFASQLLAKEIEEIYLKDPHACIKIYAHSHGGNVALQAASILQKKHLKIDMIVLMDTPIGSPSMHWVNKIQNVRLLLNCFVKGDNMQTMDVFFNNGFCKQELPNLSYIKNVQLFFYNTCHKKIPIRHSMYFFLIENDNSQSIILYIPTLIKEIEKNEDKNISYAIHKTS